LYGEEMSRIGRRPIQLPEGTRVEIKDGEVFVSGPKGSLKRQILPGIEVRTENNMILVRRKDDEKMTRAFHGLMRTLIANMVEGVNRGFEKKLEIVGLGYRVERKGKDLVFYLGYSHPVHFSLPEGVRAEVEKQNIVTISGMDKELVGTVAAKIRRLREPDVYKNKGIKYVGEVLRKKAGKSGK